MATITDYTKQTWVNNNTKISAENLNKIEDGLDALSSDAQQLASEFSTFKDTEFDLVRSNTESNSTNIVGIIGALTGHDYRIDELDLNKATKTELADVNTPIQTVSATVNAKATKWVGTNQTTHFDSVPKEDHYIKLDISLSGTASTGGEEEAEIVQKKKRIPLWSINQDFSSNASFMGTGPGTFDILYGTELWSKLLEEQPGASWENITSDEEESLLGNPITALNDKLTFALYKTKQNVNSTCNVFSPYNYDSYIDFILIFYSTENNKYYFANLNNLSIGSDLRYWVTGSMPATDMFYGYQNYLCIDQHYRNWETIQLPTTGLLLKYVAFMTKTDHLEDIGLSAFDYFNYLGDLYPANYCHPYIFRMRGNEGNYYGSFPILYTGTYYLSMMGVPQNEKDFWYKIGNSEQGPYSNTDGSMPDLSWTQCFTSAHIIYKFTCPTGTSDAYKVLELCKKHTDDDIKQITKSTLNDLISFGSDDPTSSTSGMFYFKTNNVD